MQSYVVTSNNHSCSQWHKRSVADILTGEIISKIYIASLASYLDGTNNLPRERIFNFLCDICVVSTRRVRAFVDFKNKQKSVWSNVFWCLKRKIHYPIEWIQITEWLNYMNMNSCLHLSNKLKECGKFFVNTAVKSLLCIYEGVYI